MPDFRQQTCAALISAGVTQPAQIISTVAALEKFVFSKDEYDTSTSPEMKNAVAEKTTSKKTVAATEAQKAAEEAAEKIAEAESAEQVEETAVEETQTSSPNFTKEEVHKALVGVAQKHGRAALVTILGEVKAEKLTDVAESDYPKLMKLVEDYPA